MDAAVELQLCSGASLRHSGALAMRCIDTLELSGAVLGHAVMLETVLAVMRW